MSRNVVSLDSVIFVCKVNNLGTAINAIEPTAVKIEALESVSAVMNKYCQLYSELAVLVSRYKNLLARDKNIILSAGAQMENTDRALGRMFK